MIRCHRALAEGGLATRMILTIHDELLFEGPPEEADAVRELVEREMVAPWDDRTPPLAVDVGVGRNWLEAK
jgi:DNA polymerase I